MINLNNSTIIAFGFSAPLLFGDASWEACATAAGAGYIFGIVYDKFFWEEAQWKKLNEEFEQDPEQFNIQLQEKEIGNGWILISRHSELIGSFNETEEASLVEFNSLLDQLSNKKQVISSLKSKVNISSDFTNKDKQILKEILTLHYNLKKSERK